MQLARTYVHTVPGATPGISVEAGPSIPVPRQPGRPIQGRETCGLGSLGEAAVSAGKCFGHEGLRSPQAALAPLQGAMLFRLQLCRGHVPAHFSEPLPCGGLLLNLHVGLRRAARMCHFDGALGVGGWGLGRNGWRCHSGSSSGLRPYCRCGRSHATSSVRLSSSRALSAKLILFRLNLSFRSNSGILPAKGRGDSKGNG